MKNGTIPKFDAKQSAVADVIGYRDKKGLLQTPRTPFNAGTAIVHANESLIRNVLGLNASKEDGAYIGLLKGHDIKIYLNLDALVQKHICILAKTGGGKSYACGVLIEELLKHKVPLIIIDTHGEYHSLTEPNSSKKDQKNMERFEVKKRDYESQINEYSPIGSGGKIKHLTLNGINLEAREIIDLLSAKLSGPQIGVLYQAVKEIKDFKKTWTLRDPIDSVNRSKSNAKWNVIASLESLESINVYSENGTSTSDLVEKGKPPGEGEAFHSLRRSERLAWLAANRPPASVQFNSLAAFAQREDISLILRSSYDQLALVDPRNDSQVVFHDALVPGGTLLWYLNADHWAVAMPFNREHPTLADSFVTRNAFPREILLEAIARFVEESLLTDAGHRP